MKDGLPRPVSQYSSLKEAFTATVPVIGTVPITVALTGTTSVFSDFDDILTWRWPSNGDYSASFMYKVIIEARKINWELMEVWKASAPLKIKLFSQLLLMDRLLTRERLQRLDINYEAQCVMCDEYTLETSNHLFFQCPNAKEVWNRFVNLVHEGDTVCDTWEMSSKMFGQERQGKVWISTFMSVLWSIWRQRNEVIFRDKKQPPWLVVNKAAEEVNLWQQFCRKGNRMVTKLASVTTAIT